MGNNEDIGFFPLFILGLMFVVMFLFFWIAHQLDKKNNKEIEN
jgi:preprotein translocase subunit YajC